MAKETPKKEETKKEETKKEETKAVEKKMLKITKTNGKVIYKTKETSEGAPMARFKKKGWKVEEV